MLGTTQPTPALTGTPTRNLDWRTCVRCGDDIHSSRFALGYRLCLFCGEEQATQDRKSWCVSIPYSKGAYQLITNPADLLGTNPKQPRG